MERLEASTIVYASPERVYKFLLDFPSYTRYSKYLRTVRSDGDGGPGTEYEMDFSWWKLTYTAASRVTGVDPPSRIDWTITKHIDADGAWRIEPVDPDDPAVDPDLYDGAVARAIFEVSYDAENARLGRIDLPRFVSADWVIRKVKPLVTEEAERVVRRAVRDLEDRDRSVAVEIAGPVET
ncbi:polyketide cyclase [Halobacteriales archaeon SW_7_68_16]|nr:MAG: polyketide cyclase [Halobacteriales archaeon SW_7_68_16]